MMFNGELSVVVISWCFLFSLVREHVGCVWYNFLLFHVTVQGNRASMKWDLIVDIEICEDTSVLQFRLN